MVFAAPRIFLRTAQTILHYLPTADKVRSIRMQRDDTFGEGELRRKMDIMEKRHCFLPFKRTNKTPTLSHARVVSQQEEENKPLSWASKKHKQLTAQSEPNRKTS